jgi:hypothetical protein
MAAPTNLGDLLAQATAASAALYAQLAATTAERDSLRRELAAVALERDSLRGQLTNYSSEELRALVAARDARRVMRAITHPGLEECAKNRMTTH